MAKNLPADALSRNLHRQKIFPAWHSDCINVRLLALMHRTQNHLLRSDGTSITKADQQRGAQMRSVADQWSQKTSVGFSR